ncbi:MAG TPA: NADH-quinone oxidoreductase subunit J [Burkholderiales bacterium]|nr:NADH-quinone oxidoreductase subunit J [Burkholderiales bacterium]
MVVETVVFYFFAAVLLLSGLRVITARNPVHAALFLVLSFFTASAIWLLLQAEFLAIVLVLVYVGAVMVLFLFVVMMLDINLERLREGFWRNLPLALVVGAIMAAEIIAVLVERAFEVPGHAVRLPAGYSNTRALGLLLYTHYAYALEIAAVILLVAIIAAIALTQRRRKDTKYQSPSQQVRVRPGERVQLVSMPTETDR